MIPLLLLGLVGIGVLASRASTPAIAPPPPPVARPVVVATTRKHHAAAVTTTSMPVPAPVDASTQTNDMLNSLYSEEGAVGAAMRGTLSSQMGSVAGWWLG
jgi:hypothetical protein